MGLKARRHLPMTRRWQYHQRRRGGRSLSGAEKYYRHDSWRVLQGSKSTIFGAYRLNGTSGLPPSSIPMTIAVILTDVQRNSGCVSKRRNRSRKVMLNWRAVFSTVWRCCMPMCCMSWRSCVVKISRNCILSAAAARNAAQPAVCRCLRYSGDRRAC